MKVFLGYLIMVGGVWAFAYAFNWMTTPTPHDGWLFFPFMVTFMAVECFGATLTSIWDYL